MFKEVLQIIPKLSPSDLNNMERSLSSRFNNAAKKFGKGLVGVFTGGGVAGAALGLIDKFLNPLKETQDAIDRTLKASDDLVTNAKQFNTSSGKLARLRGIGQATGLDESSLYMLITKFQTAVAEAKADPNAPSAVRNFVNEKDSAEGFFKFIQNLNKLDSNKQLLVQKEVFGEKQILKIADFLQSAGDVAKNFKGPSTTKVTKSVDKLGNLNDRADTLKAQQEYADLAKKGGTITQSMVDSKAAADQKALDRENLNIQGYKDLASVSNAVDTMANTVKELTVTITAAVARFYKLEETFTKLSKSDALRGIIRFIKAE